MSKLLDLRLGGAASWVLDGGPAHTDPTHGFIPALAVLRFNGEPAQAMDEMERLLSQPATKAAPSIVAVVGLGSVSLAGILLGPSDALIADPLGGDVMGSGSSTGSAAALSVRRSDTGAGVGRTTSRMEPIDQSLHRSTTLVEASLGAHHFSVERWVMSTTQELAEIVGGTPLPVGLADQLAAVVYHYLGMPLARLRTHRLDECPIPELRHACGHEYFWCAHEAAYANSLSQLEIGVAAELAHPPSGAAAGAPRNGQES